MDTNKKRCQAKTIKRTQCLKPATIGDFCGQHGKMRNVEKVASPVLTMATIPKMVITMKTPAKVQDDESVRRRLQEAERQQRQRRQQRQIYEAKKLQRQLQQAEFQRRQFEETQQKQRQSEELKKPGQQADLTDFNAKIDEYNRRKEQQRLQRLEGQSQERRLANIREIKEARSKKPTIKFKSPISDQEAEKMRLQRQKLEQERSKMRKQLQQQQLAERMQKQLVIEKPKKVLIIEDEEYVLYSLTDYLQRVYNCVVTPVAKLFGAGNLLKDEVYDLIITDTVFVEYSGIERDLVPKGVPNRNSIPNINLKNSNTPLIITDKSANSPNENKVYRDRRDDYRDTAKLIIRDHQDEECKPTVNKIRRGDFCLEYLMKRLLVEHLIFENHLLTMKSIK